MPPIPMVIYWTTQWRSDQKEPGLRTKLAECGIRQFVLETPGLAKTTVQRLPASDVPSNAELWDRAAKRPGNPRKLVLIVVRELGPILSIGLPFLVRGGTEVVLDVRLLDRRISGPFGQFQTHWENGGLFVVKGVRTLSGDMKAALNAALLQAVDGKHDNEDSRPPCISKKKCREAE